MFSFLLLHLVNDEGYAALHYFVTPQICMLQSTSQGFIKLIRFYDMAGLPPILQYLSLKDPQKFSTQTVLRVFLFLFSNDTSAKSIPSKPILGMFNIFSHFSPFKQISQLSFARDRILGFMFMNFSNTDNDYQAERK